jgi:hypothetical protein
MIVPFKKLPKGDFQKNFASIMEGGHYLVLHQEKPWRYMIIKDIEEGTQGLSVFKKALKRDMQLSYSKYFTDGGDIVIYQSGKPWKFMRLLGVEIITMRGVSEDEKKVREEASNEGKEVLLKSALEGVPEAINA